MSRASILEVRVTIFKCGIAYQVSELQKAAKPMTIVPITKKTILRLDNSFDEIFCLLSPISPGTAKRNRDRAIAP